MNTKQAFQLERDDTIIGSNDGHATVTEVTVMASGVLVSMNTEFGRVVRTYDDPYESVEVY